MDFFRGKGLIAERLRLAGVNDEGDLWFHIRKKFFVVEAKNTKAFSPSTWMQEAVKERNNWLKNRKSHTDATPIVIAKRRNHGIEKAFVIIELEEFVRMLDE